MKISLKNLLISLSILPMFYSLKADAQVTFTPNKPQLNGKDKFEVTLNNGKVVEIEVKVSLDDTPRKKAQKIKDALNTVNIRSTIPPTGATITIPDASGFEQTKNPSRQGAEVLKPGQVIKIDRGTKEVKGKAEAKIDFHGRVSGLDFNGLESEFKSSFGFDGVLADSNVTASMLPELTISSLLMTTYNEFVLDLPSSLQSNLKLNLADESIVFIFPDYAFNGFVKNFTSDTDTESTLGLVARAVPEPSSTFSFLALGTLGAASTLKRKLFLFHQSRRVKMRRKA